MVSQMSRLKVSQGAPGTQSHGDSWERAPARIKVVGVGGGGCNAVRRMLHQSTIGVRYVMINTDIKSLESAKGPDCELVQIGPRLTRGWGAGGDPGVGEKAAEESSSDIRSSLKDAELVFVTAGMGGGTGTGAAPYVAHLAKEKGAVVIGVVTSPFSFEGTPRVNAAMAGVARLRPWVDNLIVIHNDRLLKFVNHEAELLDAFRTADEVVAQGLLSVSELINVPGEVNVDFADVKAVMAYPGGALMAIGQGSGREGPLEAARQAMANPLLNLSIEGAKGVLFQVKGGHQLTLGGVNAAGELVAKTVSKDAKTFFGMCIDYALEDNVKITMIATGLPENSNKEIDSKYNSKYTPLGAQKEAMAQDGLQNGSQEKPQEKPAYVPPIAEEKSKRSWFWQ